MALPSTSDGFVIGVDVGGTKVAAGLVDREGKILFQTRTPMVANDDAARGLESVTSAIDIGFGQGAQLFGNLVETNSGHRNLFARSPESEDGRGD